MPISLETSLRPNDGPTSITGYDPSDASDFLVNISDNDLIETFVTQTADSNDFRNIGFQDPGVTETNADSIDEIVFNIVCRGVRGSMDMEIGLNDNLGLYPTFILSIPGTDFATLTKSFTTNTAGGALNVSNLKSLNISSFIAAGEGGGTGPAFRLVISDIRITVKMTNILPTQTITLDSGVITLDSGKITVQ
tara:strand:+ start:187 stop:765 length:579 start_codon:yes stop_codon:yes gene_type:complete